MTTATKNPPTNTRIKLEMPKHFTGTSVWHDDELIAFLNVNHDECCPDPTDCDGMGQMHSFSTRHNNFIKPEDRDALVEQYPDAVPLSYHEHGNCVWGTAGNVPPCQWDTVQFAGFWTPDETLVQLADERGLKGDERKAQMKQWAQECCDVYTDWANGSCYRYELLVFKLRKDGDDIYDQESDYRYQEPLVEEDGNCLYGLESLEEEVEMAVNYLQVEGYETMNLTSK